MQLKQLVSLLLLLLSLLLFGKGNIAECTKPFRYIYIYIKAFQFVIYMYAYAQRETQSSGKLSVLHLLFQEYNHVNHIYRFNTLYYISHYIHIPYTTYMRTSTSIYQRFSSLTF